MQDIMVKCDLKNILIIDNCPGKPVWVDNDGNSMNFSTSIVWKDIRENGVNVHWKDIVWHTNCIPKHTFILWLVVKKKPSTQDKMLKWYPNKVFECSLCNKEVDSHDHLFFKYEYAEKIWKKICAIAKINVKEEKWEFIIKEMSLKNDNKSIWGIIRWLCLAAVVYFIWQERNWRLFNNYKRNEEEVFEVIYMITLQVKLIGCLSLLNRVKGCLGEGIITHIVDLIDPKFPDLAGGQLGDAMAVGLSFAPPREWIDPTTGEEAAATGSKLQVEKVPVLKHRREDPNSASAASSGDN
ncbi:RNA-directed DNA polymerase, eukaryota, reverse transcriptase zinc-binding domain protein [Tanacetum coccineum]